MEKLSYKKVYVLKDGDETTILPDEAEVVDAGAYSMKNVQYDGFSDDFFGEKTCVYQITNGHFEGCALAESDDGLVLCEGPYDVHYNGTNGIVISEFENIEDVEHLPLKSVDTIIGKNIVEEFIRAYVATIESNPEVLKDVDMVQFSKYYKVLPENIFSLNDGAMSVKTAAYSALERIIDKKTKGMDQAVKDKYKGTGRAYLANLIIQNREKPNGELGD